MKCLLIYFDSYYYNALGMNFTLYQQFSSSWKLQVEAKYCAAMTQF